MRINCPPGIRCWSNCYLNLDVGGSGWVLVDGGFNQSLQLTLKGQPGACHLQKITTTANHLLCAPGHRRPALTC